MDRVDRMTGTSTGLDNPDQDGVRVCDVEGAPKLRAQHNEEEAGRRLTNTQTKQHGSRARLGTL